ATSKLTGQRCSARSSRLSRVDDGDVWVFTERSVLAVQLPNSQSSDQNRSDFRRAARLFFVGKGWTSVCAILLASRLTGGWFMANAKALPNLETLPTSPPLVQTLPSDAVLDALKMILLGAPLNEVLTTITRLIEAHSEGMLCCIFLVDEDGLHLRYGIAENLPETYRAATDGICIGPDVGSSGAAAYLRQPVFVADILSDPKWVKFKDSAVAAGLRAAWSSPILSHDGKVLGTFDMYYREVRHVGTDKIQLIDYASRIAGIAIDQKRAEEKLRQDERELRQLIDTLPHYVLVPWGG